MTKPKLTYFDLSGSRGEECRLALSAAGVDFEDNRLPRRAWADLKASTPFGSLPTLEIEGRGTLAETNAILTFIGRMHGLHPQDPWEAARHEAVMSACEHFRQRMSETVHMKDERDRKAAREALLEGAVPLFGRSVEAQIGDGPFFAGDKMHVVDIKLYMIVRWLVSGVLDHIPTTVFDQYPRLIRLYEAVGAHPKVVQWINRV